MALCFFILVNLETILSTLLKFAFGIDWLNDRLGRLATWTVLLAALIITLFVLNLRRAGELAGRLAERLSTSERTHEIQRQMLDGASRRPADRDALADRLRDGRF